MKSHEFIMSWSDRNPKSICACGHTGDGGRSQHKDTLQLGHGRCLSAGCNCQQFTWSGWTERAKLELELI